MNKCASIALLILSSLHGEEAPLSYGLLSNNGEYIQKVLKAMPEKEYAALFAKEIGEKIALSYIHEACNHPLVLLRLEGLFGARNAQNAEGVLLIEKALNDPHEVVRYYARRASESFFDAGIQQALLLQAKTKKGQERIEAFSIVASHTPDEAFKLALALFEDKEIPLIEKIGIGERLASLPSYRNPDLFLSLFQKMAQPETRLWLLSSCPSMITKEMVLTGLKSDSLDYQIAALECMGLWGLLPGMDQEVVRPLLEDKMVSSNMMLRAKAAWVVLCHFPDMKEAARSIIKGLSNSGDQEAALASETIVRSGQASVFVAQDLSDDPIIHPLVALNATLHLLRYRVQLEKKPFSLLSILKTITRPLQINEETPAEVILFAQDCHDDISRQIVQYQDVAARSFLFGLALNVSDTNDVASLAYPMAEEIFKKKSFGPLLEGGCRFFFQVGPKSFSLAKRLSASQYEEVRIQAIALLAALHHEKEAIELLRQELLLASFDGRMAILALLPQFSLNDALPFLEEALKDKSSLLRTRAAGVYLYMKYQ